MLSRRLSWLTAPRAHDRPASARSTDTRQHLRQRNDRGRARRVQAPLTRALAGDEGGSGDAPSSSSSSSGGVEAGSYTYAAMAARLDSMDANQLQTALATAIAAEDYALASRVRDALAVRVRGAGGSAAALDWRSLGVQEWLADRLERLQLPFPTEVQRRALPVLQSGADAVITSQTGSGKTLAVLVPALSFALDYPPALFPEDLDGPQLLVLVPTFELGVQACLLVYKLLGGNVSARHPGDAANMFTFTGPRGIKVKGLLNEEEVMMAKQGQYLKGVHVIVATPDAALAVATGPGALPLFRDLKMVVCDEVDALLAASVQLPSGVNPEPSTAATAGAEQLPSGLSAATIQVLDMAMVRQEPPEGDVAGGARGTGDGDDDTTSNPAGPSGRVDADAPGADAAAGAGEASWDLEDRMARLQTALRRRESKGGGSSLRLGSSSSNDSGSSSSSSAGATAIAGAASSSGDSDAAAGTSSMFGSSGAGSGSSSGSSELEAELAAVDVPPLGKPQLVFLGATVTDNEVNTAVDKGWMVDHVEVAVGQADRVPNGLKHRVVVAEGARKLAVLTRMLRLDLEVGSADAAPARAIVFAESEQQARFAADPLRSALWSQHALSVLLPGGAEPVKALTAFRDRAASLLLATPAAARGLDLPAVSHVYNLGLPSDAAEYLHRAGRSGRVGSTTGGIVTSIVTPDELPHVLGICKQLGLPPPEVDDDIAAELAAAAELAGAAGGPDAGEPALGKLQLGDEQLGKLRRGLEDLYNLM